ncbi:MAG: prepilin-type N-terminal cleavage/methylation domain-containing protein [Candidatus Gastranaerophilales bacterium]|nr:prepilin-type N-terminal cleavage/methylation domain-containing protein [Candidatus Gastranaerophilales bacterium]
MKKGFTLAEVLITLVIIGVIAAMTIPTLMNSTNQQEFRTGFKKAISSLNQALSLNYALEATQLGDATLDTETNVLNNLFKKRMSVVGTATSVGFATDPTSLVGTPTDNQGVFYTADGMRFGFKMTTGKDTEANEYYYGYILIDVNGEKGPNTMTTTASAPKDTYIATMYGNRVVAGTPTTSDASTAAKEVLFDKKYADAVSSGT